MGMGQEKGPSVQQLGGGKQSLTFTFQYRAWLNLKYLLFPQGQAREWYRMVLNWSRNWWPCLAGLSWVTSLYLNAVKWQLTFPLSRLKSAFWQDDQRNMYFFFRGSQQAAHGKIQPTNQCTLALQLPLEYIEMYGQSSKSGVLLALGHTGCI